MTIIADSGSTKTTWMEVASGNMTVTEGLNPHFTTDEAFLAACSLVRQELSITNYQSSIVFYGAGCGSEVQRKRVKGLLQKAFGINDVQVETDMLGACRAVCGHRAGLVGILGTGSNACYYDGNAIQYRAVSTGYVLGDEGSANHVGRRLLQDYLTGVMPPSLMIQFKKDYPLTDDEFLDAVYHQPHANRFLASLARFAVKHIDSDYCSSEIISSLNAWYDYQVDGLQRVSRCRVLNLVGGFAAHVRPQVEAVAKEHGLAVGTVVADPIDGLRRYHEQKKSGEIQ